jgi:hypothetical protein
VKHSGTPGSGLGNHLGNLWRLSHARSRSISPENFSGEPGAGGMAEDGPAARAAAELGRGWKVSPFVVIAPGQTFVLADIAFRGRATTSAPTWPGA